MYKVHLLKSLHSNNLDSIHTMLHVKYTYASASVGQSTESGLRFTPSQKLWMHQISAQSKLTFII